jgi:hypothetical protein
MKVDCGRRETIAAVGIESWYEILYAPQARFAG